VKELKLRIKGKIERGRVNILRKIGINRKILMEISTSFEQVFVNSSIFKFGFQKRSSYLEIWSSRNRIWDCPIQAFETKGKEVLE